MYLRTDDREEEAHREGHADRDAAAQDDFGDMGRQAAACTGASRRHGPSSEDGIRNIPETVDDFLRNFLQRHALTQTLESFQAEWYGSAQKLLTQSLSAVPEASGIFFVPDAVTHTQLLRCELDMVRRESGLLRREVLAAADSLVRMRRERDFHQLQHQRLLDDKRRLLEELRRLQRHLDSYQPLQRQLDGRYQDALREQMTVEKEQDQQANQDKAKNKTDREKRIKRSSAQANPQNSSCKHPKEFPVCGRPESLRVAQEEAPGSRGSATFNLHCSFRAHRQPISCLSLHPSKAMLTSASDDCSWRLWRLPSGPEKVAQMLLTGQGHSNWLSGCSFHPEGSKLATTSGDTTVRVWDVSRGSCVLTLCGHSQPTWGCSFHPCGHFLASCSSDRTTKLWDLNSRRCHLTLRRHSASVNAVCFLPFSNLLLSCSADKTLSLWDARQGICSTVFSGHQHPCNHVAFSQADDLMASCDSKGVVNIWDIRAPAAALRSIDAGPLSANQLAFSPAGGLMAVASNDSVVRLVELDSNSVRSLHGHSEGVQSVTFGHRGETLMSASSDGLINIWM